MTSSQEISPGLVVQRFTPPLSLRDFKLIAFDMDSTLINIECVDEIADAVGRKSQVAAITEATMRGEIADFKESLRQRVALLKGVPVSAMQEILEKRLQLNPGAAELVSACKAAGMKVLLVSGGFTFFSDRVRDRLGIDFTRANILEVQDDLLTGKMIDQAWGDICDGAEKRKMLLLTCGELGIEPSQTIAVGDGANDLPMMGMAGLSVAYHAKPKVREQAMVAINTGGLDRLLEVVTAYVPDKAAALDLSVLDELVGNDATKFRKFALLFLSSLEDVLKQVDEACDQGDMATLAAMGHRAKSTAMNIGAAEFSHQCLQLEQTAKAQDTAAAIAIGSSLRPMFLGIRAAIEQRLAT